jgi:hypothetical protein
MCSWIVSKPARSARFAPFTYSSRTWVDVGFGPLARRGPVAPNRMQKDRSVSQESCRLEPLPAFPRPLRGCLAPCVSDLDAELRGADALAVRDHTRQRRLAVVRIDADAAMRDSARAARRRSSRRTRALRLNSPASQDASCASRRSRRRCRVLAHRRDVDAVGELEAIDLVRRERGRWSFRMLD